MSRLAARIARLEARLKERERRKVVTWDRPAWMKRMEIEKVDPGATAARTDDADVGDAALREKCGVALVESKSVDLACGACRQRQRPPMEIA